jgi:thiosulfate/3-mercaptopyruvate sulfurtransferase
MGATVTESQVLVSTEWVAEHLNDTSVRIVEVDVDKKAYDEGHIPGAIGWAWDTQLCDTVQRTKQRLSFTVITTTGSPPGRFGS